MTFKSLAKVWQEKVWQERIRGAPQSPKELLSWFY